MTHFKPWAGWYQLGRVGSPGNPAQRAAFETPAQAPEGPGAPARLHRRTPRELPSAVSSQSSSPDRAPSRNDPGASSDGILARAAAPRHASDLTVLVPFAAPEPRCGPRSKNTDWMAANARRGGADTDGDARRQRQVHGERGSTMPDERQPGDTQRSRRAAEGFKSIRLQDGAAQRCVAGIGRDIAGNADNARGPDRAIRETPTKAARSSLARPRRAVAQVAQQQEVEFLHAAPAAPLELAEFGSECRSVSLLVLALEHHLLDLGDRLGGIQVLRAGLGAIHDRVAAIQPERIFELVEPLAGGLVAAESMIQR